MKHATSQAGNPNSTPLVNAKPSRSGFARIGIALLVTVASVLMFAAGFELPNRYLIQIIERGDFPQEGYRPITAFPEGKQYMMVFIGSAACDACADDRLPNAIEEIKLRTAQFANARGASFKAIAVSANWLTSNPIPFLTRFGRFDEIMAGSSWANSFIVDHLYRSDFKMGVPMVAFFERTVEIRGDSTKAMIVATEPVLIAYRKDIDPILQLSKLSVSTLLENYAESSEY